MSGAKHRVLGRRLRAGRRDRGARGRASRGRDARAWSATPWSAASASAPPGCGRDSAQTFDLPRAIVHCDTPRLALFDADGGRARRVVRSRRTRRRAKSWTARWRGLRQREGAQIRTRRALPRAAARANAAIVVEYADLAAGERRTRRARATCSSRRARPRGSTRRRSAASRWHAGATA